MKMSCMEKMERMIKGSVGSVAVPSPWGSQILLVAIGAGWGLSQSQEQRRKERTKSAVTSHYFHLFSVIIS